MARSLLFQLEQTDARTHSESLNKFLEDIMKRILTRTMWSLTLMLALAAPATFAAQTAMVKPKAQKAMSPRAEALKKCNDDYSAAAKQAADAYKAAVKDAATKKGKDHAEALKAASKTRSEALAAARKAKADCVKAAPKK
jgi:hypothetical protein